MAGSTITSRGIKVNRTSGEVKENGINIGQIQSKLLQKMEEMTLYVIDLKKENERLKERIASLENRLL